MSKNKITISALCSSVSSGATPLRSERSYWENGSIPWFKTGELADWFLDQSEEYITEDALANTSVKMFPANTVLMAMYGDGKTITSLALLRQPATTNQACCAMLVEPTVCNPLFLFYSLKHHRHELLQRVVAGAQRNLSVGIIKDFEVTVFPLDEQNRIADILSAYDDLIENNRRRIALLEQAARELYREWFVRLRFPGHEHVKIVNGVPEGWEACKVSQLLAKAPSTKKIPKDEYRYDGRIPCVDQSQDFIGGYTDDAEAEIGAPLPLILFGDHTRCLKYIDFPFARGADGTQLLIPSQEEITPVFLYFALEAIDLSNFFYARHFKFLKAATLVLPPEKLIKDFTDFAAPNMTLISQLRRHIKLLGTARDLLLPRLINGSIAV